MATMNLTISLSQRFPRKVDRNGHIDVEPFADGRRVNYLHKYLVKGKPTKQLHSAIPEGQRTVNLDEIHDFVSAHYPSASEAYWHLMSIPMHFSTHVVLSLPIHMPCGQCVVFSDGQEKTALIRQARKKSQLHTFFDLNRQEKVANADLKYEDLPLYYTWHDKENQWCKRLRKNKDVIVRIVDVPPKYVELYHLRILLLHVVCPTSLEDCRTFENVTFSTFKEACRVRGLISEEGHYVVLEQAKALLVPNAFCRFFVQLVVFCLPSNPPRLMESYRVESSSDWNARLGRNADRAKLVVGTLLTQYFRSHALTS